MKFYTNNKIYVKNGELYFLNNTSKILTVSVDEINALFIFTSGCTLENAKRSGVNQKVIESLIVKRLVIQEDVYKIDSWEVFNWQRASFLNFSQLNKINECKFSFPENYTEIDYNNIFKRRSIRLYEYKTIEMPIMLDIAQSLFNASDDDLIDIYYYLQKVGSLKRGIYMYRDNTMQEFTFDVSNKDIIECVQGQYWIGGGGFCIFFTINFEKFTNLNYSSRDYINLLVHLGELGQSLINICSMYGLGSWMTPAITESKAKKLLKINSEQIEPLYFYKVGYPKNNQS